jgi:hypothetical protein
MSHSHEQSDPSYAELSSFTRAARLAIRAQRARGRDTQFDHFLMDHVGDRREGHPGIPYIARTALSGAVLSYNNPLTMRRSYSAEGTMLSARWAEGMVEPGDILQSVIVATADLRTGVTTEWNVTELSRSKLNNTTYIGLEAPQPLRLVIDETSQAYDDPLEASLANSRPRAAAQLVLDVYGAHFTPMVGSTENLNPMQELVTEVDELAKLYRLDPVTRLPMSAEEEPANHEPAERPYLLEAA